jgi:transcriptional regulator with XRE-family HTH domain
VDLMARLAEFSEFVAAAARAAGFDIDSPRGGGKKLLAEAAGMSHATVSRMLSGQAMPDPYGLERVAEALNMPLVQLLVRSGVVTRETALPEVAAGGQGPVTAAVLDQLTALRRAQKVSAQELADRMTRLGYPIKRSVIANCESGRRAEVSVDHLAFAARALGADAATVLRGVISPCPHCQGAPPEGFTCNTCGGA